jgi:anti-sigma factor RsiW
VNCREFVAFLMEYLDGTLGPAEREVFERHLRDCPPCGIYLDTYQETIRLGRDALCAADGPLPEEAPEELVAAILAARRAAGGAEGEGH